MKDILKDIVKNIHSLGAIQAIKIQGSQDQTWLYALPEDRSFYAKAKFHQTVLEFAHTFGMSNLDQLQSMLTCPVYDEESTISVLKNKNNCPEIIHFANKDLSYENNYRLMAENIIDALVPIKPFKGATWHHSLVPSTSSILKFKYQSQTHSDSIHCRFFTEKSNLIVEMGDRTSGHVGKFVFEPNVTAVIHSLEFPVQRICSILNLAGDKQIKLSNEGVMEITVDSGLAFYDYKIMALSK